MYLRSILVLSSSDWVLSHTWSIPAKWKFSYVCRYLSWVPMGERWLQLASTLVVNNFIFHCHQSSSYADSTRKCFFPSIILSFLVIDQVLVWSDSVFITQTSSISAKWSSSYRCILPVDETWSQVTLLLIQSIKCSFHISFYICWYNPSSISFISISIFHIHLHSIFCGLFNAMCVV